MAECYDPSEEVKSRMGLQLLTERRSEQIAGVPSCYDRMLIQGTLPGLCYAEGMTTYLYAHHIRIFDYAQWAQPLRETLRENAERLAAENGLEIEFIRRPKSFRKEDKIHQVLKQRGEHPGLVWIFSVMELCSTYRPWHDKTTGKTYLRPDDGKCLHCYFYFIDEELGQCYVRVPTWCPFRLQIYLNGHHRLAGCNEKRSITPGATMPSLRLRILSARSRSPTIGRWRSCTASWMRGPSAAVR